MKWADGYARFFRCVRIADTDRINRDVVLGCPRYHFPLESGAGIVQPVRDQNQLAVRIVRPLQALQSSVSGVVKGALTICVQGFDSLSGHLMIGGERLAEG